MKIILILLFLFMDCQTAFSQDTKATKEEKRTFFIFFNLGVIDFLSLGTGYQIEEDFALAIKASHTWIQGDGFIVPNSGAGLGFKLSYFFFPSFIFNSVSFEYIAYLSLTYSQESVPKGFIKGNYFDFNFGNQKINDNGLCFFWAIGFCASSIETKNDLFSPSIKIGLAYNFF